jgi:hypothetical protein
MGDVDRILPRDLMDLIYSYHNPYKSTFQSSLDAINCPLFTSWIDSNAGGWHSSIHVRCWVENIHRIARLEYKPVRICDAAFQRPKVSIYKPCVGKVLRSPINSMRRGLYIP